MADDKKTQIGSPGAAAVRAAANVSVAPVSEAAPALAVTSYIPESSDPLVGQTLADRYFVKKKLGEGGMGAVYLATHKLLEKEVALKVLHGEFARKPDLVERFMQEAKSASRIRHENVIDISDFGVTPDGLVFFAMELLQGSDLHGVIGTAKSAGELLPWARSRPIFLQISAALIAAHSHGIIHRDLKPENVYLVDFLGQPDFVKLLDFGIAKLTEVNEGDRKLTKTGMLFGTPEYMAPEQARGDQADVRVDVYAMACILFQLVTGRVPFEADNFMGVLTMHLMEPAPTIDIAILDAIGAPRGLAGIISKGLEKNRDQRWQNMTDFSNALRALHGEPPLAAAKSTQTGDRVSVSMPVVTAKQTTDAWRGSVRVSDGAHSTSAPPKTKLLWIGAAIVAAAATAGVILVTKGGRSSAPTPTIGSAAGSTAATPVAAVPPPVGTPTPVPTEASPQQTVTPPVPAIPDVVKITITSDPIGAVVYANGGTEKLGKTPRTLEVKGSATPRYYLLKMRGYKEVTLEVPLVADATQDVKLEKGEGSVTRTDAASNNNTVNVAVPVTKPTAGKDTKTEPVSHATAGDNHAVIKKPPVDPPANVEVKPDKPVADDDTLPHLKPFEEKKPD